MSDGKGNRPTVEILGCPVDRVSMAGALERIERMITGGGRHQVMVLSVDGIMHGWRDRRLRRICGSVSLVVPDGVPLLWAARLLGAPIPGRVAGPDLLWELSRVAARQGYTCFFLGSTPVVLARLSRTLRGRFPALRLAGAWSPPFARELPEATSEEIIRRVNAARPDILWVAMGTPKQETWIRAHLDRLDTRVAIGVGGAFEMCSGVARRAPRWMQRAGLEWFHRFLLEPGRLFRRYFIHSAPFFPLVAWQRAKRISRFRSTAVRGTMRQETRRRK